MAEVKGAVNARCPGGHPLPLGTLSREAVIKAIYNNLFRDIERRMIPGRTIEIGGGAECSKNSHPTSSTQTSCGRPSLIGRRCPAASLCLRQRFQSRRLPPAHHIEFPVLFFPEAERVLAERGRIIMVEPGITP